jgi:hypothetical protein
MTPTNSQIKHAMYNCYQLYKDSSDCLLTTFLAEDVANSFHDNPEDGSPIDERYFDIAAEVDHELYQQGLVNE